MPNIYQIAHEYRAISDVLHDSECDDDVLRDTLEAESWDMEEKAKNYAFVIRNLEETAMSIKEAEKDMSARRASIERRVERLKERLKDAMLIAGMSKIITPYFLISVAKNPPSVKVIDESIIPSKFMVQKDAPPACPDKAAIKEAIKAGEDVPGVALGFGTSLQISI